MRHSHEIYIICTERFESVVILVRESYVFDRQLT